MDNLPQPKSDNEEEPVGNDEEVAGNEQETEIKETDKEKQAEELENRRVELYLDAFATMLIDSIIREVAISHLNEIPPITFEGGSEQTRHQYVRRLRFREEWSTTLLKPRSFKRQF
ncbi:uncharacterized protein LOC109609491 [Aethina tumida]|uniref:uncharacterized protein LOC109609491 n=1 Tax=Aethina tumida TaxID=116153 RepID=UPI00096AF2DD|nr:uncharacterized protein LOC109609491 [Aethina tumida]